MTLRASARGFSVEGALPWLIALAGFALDVAAFWPGQMSFDSAYAWWQARGGETTNIAPPMLIFVWRACDALLEGPGLVFALHLALFWSGLALLVDDCALIGWIANRIDGAMDVSDENIETLRERIPAPLLGVLAHAETPSEAEVVALSDALRPF